jgi:hypothetical protein
MALMVTYWQIILCVDVEQWVEQRNERQMGNMVVRSWVKELEWIWKKTDHCFVA